MQQYPPPVPRFSVPRGLTFNLNSKGEIEARISESSGSFILKTEILIMLCLFKQGIRQDRIKATLQKHLSHCLNTIPSEVEIDQIANDLWNAGLLYNQAQNIKSGINAPQDGFADPWIQWAMLADSRRVNSYWDSIKKTITPTLTVLDVGAGTGLLSAMALKAGAKKVIAIEETAMAINIEKNLKAAGIDTEKKLFVKNSNSFDANIDSSVDVVVSELFGNDPFSEGLLPTLIDIKKRIQNKSVKFLPEKVTVYYQIIDFKNSTIKERLDSFMQASQTQDQNNFLQNFLHVTTKTMDMSDISFAFSFSNHEAKAASEAKAAFSINLDPPITNADTHKPQTINITCNQKPTCPTIMQWFRVQVSSDVTFSSSPLEHDYANHWSPILIPLKKTLAEKEGVLISYALKDKICIKTEVFNKVGDKIGGK